MTDSRDGTTGAEIGSLDRPSVRLRGEGGYLRVSFGEQGDLLAHATSDILTHLVDVMSQLAEGVQVASCRAPGEQGGAYVDFVRTPKGTVSVAVQYFVSRESVNYRNSFSATRGQLMYELHVDERQFLCAFAREVWALLVSSTDKFGFITSLGRRFPGRSFDRLCQALDRRFGYRLPAPDEILKDYNDGLGSRIW